MKKKTLKVLTRMSNLCYTMFMKNDKLIINKKGNTYGDI